MKTFILAVTLVLCFHHTQLFALIIPVLYVKPDGTASSPCGTSPALACKNIATAVEQANTYSTTTIKVAQGIYQEFIYIRDTLPEILDAKLTIDGGWNNDFSHQTQNPSLTRLTPPAATILDITIDSFESVELAFKNLSFIGMLDNHDHAVSAYSSHAAIDLEIENCTIESFRQSGIKITSHDGSNNSLTIRDSTIKNIFGPSSFLGGGINAVARSSSTLDVLITNTIIRENQAEKGGGAYLKAHGDGVLNASISNTIFTQNQSVNAGGALRIVASDGALELILTNNTITSNQAGTNGNNVDFSSFDTATLDVFIRNSIIWGAGIDDIRMMQASPSTLTVNMIHSILGDIVNEQNAALKLSNNLYTDPLLKRNYHQVSASPGRGKGICGISPLGHYIRIAPYDDIEGDLRPGFGELLGCDIGADEFRFPWILFNGSILPKNE